MKPVQIYSKKYCRLVSTIIGFAASLLVAHQGQAQTVAPIVKSNVRVIPVSGPHISARSHAARIIGSSSSSLTIDNAPTLRTGDVIVSGEGRGSLRKVVSTKIIAGHSVITTGPATLADVFKQAHIHLARKLGFQDFTSIVPLQPGVTIRRGGGAAAIPGRATAQSTVNLSGLSFDFVHVGFKASTTDQNSAVEATLDGSASVSPSVDVDLQISPFSGVTYALFDPAVNASTNLTLSLQANGTIPEQTLPIAHLEGAPITVTVGFVPVVFTPEIDVSAVCGGSATGQVQLVATESVNADVRVEYANGTTTAAMTVNPTSSFVPSVRASANAHISPLQTRFDLLVYGVAGPYLKFDVPDIQGTLTYSPPTFHVKADAVFNASAGFGIHFLGYDQDYEAPIYSQTFNIVDASYGDGGPMTTPTPSPTPPAPPTLDHIVLTPLSPSVTQGNVVQFGASGVDTTGAWVFLPDNHLSWTSSDGTVASFGNTRPGSTRPDASGAAGVITGARGDCCLGCSKHDRGGMAPGATVRGTAGAGHVGCCRQLIVCQSQTAGLRLLPRRDSGDRL